MNWPSCLLWGFAATAVLTTLMAGSEGIGLTRMNIPHMLGTMFTPNRDRAKVYGAMFHFLNGWAFSIVYVAAFHVAHRFDWWFGALVGLVHGAFVAAVALPVMPGVHPRMASELRGPTVGRQLEPPGFLALNYGARTPISILLAHVAFGAILGSFYAPPEAAHGRSRNTPSTSSLGCDGMHVPYASDGPPFAGWSETSNTNPHSRCGAGTEPSRDVNSSSGRAPTTAACVSPHAWASQGDTSTVNAPRLPGARSIRFGPTGPTS
jgi:hypothetical protein